MVDRYPVFIERQNEGDSPDPRLVIAIGQGPANSIKTICVGDPFANGIFQALPKISLKSAFASRTGNKAAISNMPSGSLSTSSINAFSRFQARSSLSVQNELILRRRLCL